MPTLFDTLTRHQIYLEGYKNGLNRDFENGAAAELVKELRKLFAVLDFENISDMNKTQLNAFLKELIAVNKRIFSKYYEAAIKAIRAFMEVDRELSVELMKDEDNVIAWILFLSANDRLWSQIINSPMPASGLYVLPTLSAFIASSSRNIEALITKAWANGDSAAETLANIIGRKSNAFKDGEMARIIRANRASVGTIIQHFSSEVQHSIGTIFYDEYEWSSIIDSSTTDICRSRDGNIYAYGRGPLPPAHIGCRSKIIPRNRGAGPTPVQGLGAWSSAQPSRVVNDMFVGNPSDKTFRPLTLAQFRARRNFMTATD